MVKTSGKLQTHKTLNSLWRSDVIWYISGSTLASDGLSPKHTKTLPEPMLTYHQICFWHSPENGFTRSAHKLNPWHAWEVIILKLLPYPSWAIRLTGARDVYVYSLQSTNGMLHSEDVVYHALWLVISSFQWLMGQWQLLAGGFSTLLVEKYYASNAFQLYFFLKSQH